MSNRELFKETFGQVTMSEEKFREVRNATVEVREKGNIIRYAAVFAALAVVILLSGNGMIYAMTGETLVDKVQDVCDSLIASGRVTQQNVVVEGTVNSSREDIVSTEAPQIDIPRIIDFYVDENGVYTYEMEVNGVPSTCSIRVEGDPKHTSVIVFCEEKSCGIMAVEGTLHEQAGRIILEILGQMIDITEDIEDGVAIGEIVEKSGLLKGTSYAYTIEGTLEDYTVSVRLIVPEKTE